MSAPLAIEWVGDIDGFVRLIDQTRLPSELVQIDCRDAATIWEAIKMLRVRGAPAIGITAAMGLVVGARTHESRDGLREHIHQVADYLRTSRPTAVNLFWALDRMERVADACEAETMPHEQTLALLLMEAKRIRDEDREMCIAIGQHGKELLANDSGVLTHCNTGALATADYGTALSVIFHAHEAKKNIVAYVDETRPLLQGSRLTAWELQQRGVPATLICDNMAATVMRQGRVQAVIVGADRIAANGDTANKIGTYGLAVLAKAHGIPFYVAAPSSTFDFELADGSGIPIEERDSREVTHPLGLAIAPDDVAVYNPAFDVTPAELVAAFVTEQGVIRAPYVENLAALRKDSA
ncbi:S-methyl-5-thioribose-1-phosphate isomerase [Planctomycetes bacterium Pan216]